MKKILLLALALITSNGHAALTEVDKSLYSERNLLPNPGFENGKNTWLSSSATLTATTTAANVLYGTASGSILISSNSGYVRSKTVAVPTALYGQACEAKVLFKGGDALTTFEVYNRDNTLLGSLALTAQADVGMQSVFFMCPTAAQVAGDADTGFIYSQIKQTSAGTHTVMYTDNWYMGQLLNLGEATTPDVFSAKVSSTGVVSDESGDFINGNCVMSGGASNIGTCTFTSSMFSVAPNCVMTSSGNGEAHFESVIATASQVSYTGLDGAANSANAGQIYCMKQGVDAKQAVQVYKSIPKVADNINQFSAAVSSTDIVSSENADWINGDCTNGTTGEATCVPVANTFSVIPNCTATSDASGVTSCVYRRDLSTSSSLRFSCFVTSTGAAINQQFTASCQKAGVDFKMPVVQPIFAPTGLAGTVVNSAYFQTGAVATGTTTIPIDDTIPQITEGTEFMTLAYTPRSATNLLRITVIAGVNPNGNLAVSGALFQDAIANAIASSVNSHPVSGAADTIVFTHNMVAGTTSATTFKFRAGPSSAGTVTFNGAGGARYFGGVYASSILIEEIAQ